MKWTEILTSILALYGALLSSLVFWKEHEKSKRKLKITMKHGFLTYGNGGTSDNHLMLEASNDGHKPVTISSVSIELPNNRKLAFANPEGTHKLPHELTEGKSITTWYPLKHLETNLIESGFSKDVYVKATFTDQTGKNHKSKKFKIKIN